MLVSVSSPYDQAWNAPNVDRFAIGHLNHQASSTTHPTSLILLRGTAVPSYLSFVWRRTCVLSFIP
jgi:hypothetical protein